MLPRLFSSLIVLAALLGVSGEAAAQTLAGAALVDALRQGGYVLLMRHAHAPDALPDKTTADPGNAKGERQLDEAGRGAAVAMGEALKKLRIPLGTVLSSSTYRALETVRLAGFGTPQTAPELGDAGKSMQAVGAEFGAFIRGKVAERPRAGTNTIIVTHQPNIAAAYADKADGLTDGEALVFRPDGNGGAALVARVKMDEWPRLAAAP